MAVQRFNIIYNKSSSGRVWIRGKSKGKNKGYRRQKSFAFKAGKVKVRRDVIYLVRFCFKYILKLN